MDGLAGGQDRSAGRKSDLKSIDHRFELHCRQDVFWSGRLASLPLKIASMGSDDRSRKMEVRTSG